MTATPDEAKPSSTLEIWSKNERMRHVPTIEWMMQKLDADVRRRIQHILASLDTLPGDDERRGGIEATLQAFGRAAERVAVVARHGHGAAHPPAELAAHVTWSLNLAVNALGAMDPETAGRRLPFQTFERSNAEPLYAAVLALVDRLKRATDLAREADPSLDERLLENLVTLQNPVDDRMLRPIA